MGPRRQWAFGIATSVACALVVNAVMAVPAEARRHHHRHHAMHHRHGQAHHRAHHATRGYHPPFAAIVVDAHNGKVLYAEDAKAPRHPASLTKVMTLYLLFEQLDRGAITMNTRIPVSAHAASMAPTKLGLPPGDTIAVGDAIKAIVTQSANDMAVAVAEFLGGSESAFCEMMTRKAHQLGMDDTRYVNASGLPDDRQITTAYDLAILARAIQERFPRYYPVFATRSFYYDGRTMRNHNHLLGRVEGLDGIKTGFTTASGFNLMTNVRRDGRQIVGVVLGGPSAAIRDRIMAGLIDKEIEVASVGGPVDRAVAEAPQRARPAVVAAASSPLPPGRPLSLASGEPADARLPSGTQAYASTTTPASPRWSVASKLVQVAAERQEARGEGDGATAPEAKPARGKLFTDRLSARDIVDAPRPPARIEPSKNAVLAKLDTPKEQKTDNMPTGSVPERSKPEQRLGWVIQLGALPEKEKATEMLRRAKSSTGVLSKAESFTEKVVKDGNTLFRARFAGFNEESAQNACRALKRSGFACFATRG
jgi:D-alanyl-D-alanine carboxypeptidase